MLLKFCILHSNIIVPRHVFWWLFFRLGLFMSYLYDQFFIIILIFIKSNHIISFKKTHLFSWHFCLNFSLRVLLTFCLIFSQFVPGVTYKKSFICIFYWNMLCESYGVVPVVFEQMVAFVRIRFHEVPNDRPCLPKYLWVLFQ